jgi:hypothetical protein
MAVWMTIEVARPAGDTASGAKSSESGTSAVLFAAAGASSSERAPFQDRFMKEWPQLTLEASRAAAACCARTLQTGVEAPLSRYEDRVATLPVHAPGQADALLFHSGGRSVAPALLQHLPTNVSNFFHPDILPVMPDETASARAVAEAISVERRGEDPFWTSDERPSGQRAAALGRRLKVQYVLMARVSDLELALVNGPRMAAGALSTDRTADVLTADSAPRDTATAEAIGALVRVSDGAVLWNERTKATMSGQLEGRGLENARRHMAIDAVRFSLLQLERRFKQFRLRYE